MRLSGVRRLWPFLNLLALANASCTLQQPNDLKLEAVYIADRTSLPEYKRNVREGFIKAVGLVLEVSTKEAYEYGAFAIDGFCEGEFEVGVLGDGTLYKVKFQSEVTSGDTSPNKYLVLADLQSRYVRSRPNLPKFDLEHDRRDICVRTVFQGQVGPLVSNVVRVPRALVDQALKGRTSVLPMVGNAPKD